ncbi:hypothetical protein [Hydrogenimonas cancrithermarum]|uniref:3-dehydroquinate dehydratase n=1 Tax=Hydrogenimonas cancrithermarum TaxID=2993563 RepID=A0ABM8FKH3_9BACT|nr:hypothetical protein [Hydrogenimonas cancrithermarum]BDY12808.1 hypothetical protein HCR_11200 [Hydrogenimonas cancrithermarum]
MPLLLILLSLGSSLFARTTFSPIIANDAIMPDKEIEKLNEMGRELYQKAHVPVFVAAVDDLNRTKPIDLIERIEREYPTYILLYFSKHPTSVNIFSSDDAKKLADFDQILSPLPWLGTIKPVMSPAFSKNEAVKLEVAIFNGYADIVDQVAKAKGVKLSSSIGSGSKDSFLIVRWIFYGILAFIFLRYIYYKRKQRG